MIENFDFQKLTRSDNVTCNFDVRLGWSRTARMVVRNDDCRRACHNCQSKYLSGMTEDRIHPLMIVVDQTLIHFGKRCAAILKSLPQTGPLFPNLRKVKSKDRANEFRQRCQGLRIKDVTLHSYRYSWAERARKTGYPRREAEEVLGHNCRAVHIAYASRAQVTVAFLEDYEEMAAKKVMRSELVEGTNHGLPEARP